MAEATALLLARLDALRRAERRAASARMVAVAGHLAGTPLNVIAGRAALIRANPSPKSIEENVRRIEEQVERMALQMRRLIEYFGLAESAAEHCTVGEILAECRAVYLPVAQLRGVAVEVGTGDVEALRIEAEVAPLVLTTLVSLAVHTAAPGQSVTLDAIKHGPRGVAFDLTMPNLRVPLHFERLEPPEQAGHADPGTLETFWTCLGLAQRIGGSLSTAQAASRPGTTVRFTCAPD